MCQKSVASVSFPSTRWSRVTTSRIRSSRKLPARPDRRRRCSSRSETPKVPRKVRFPSCSFGVLAFSRWFHLNRSGPSPSPVAASLGSPDSQWRLKPGGRSAGGEAARSDTGGGEKGNALGVPGSRS